MSDPLEGQIAKLLEQNLAIAVPDQLYATPLVDVPGSYYDSLKVLEVISLLEREFDVAIDIASDDIQHALSSVSEMAALMARKRDAARFA